MQKFVLAGVGTVDLIDKSTGEIIAKSNTLVESGINFSVSAEDIRGGLANKLLSQYFHNSSMTLTLKDALFNMQYLALNVGGTISVGGDVMATEQVTSDAGGFSISETPQDFFGLGTIGWYTISGKDEWHKITFNGTRAQVASLTAGSILCVKYIKRNETVEQFTVSSAFIPSQCYALLTLPLFKTGMDTKTYTSSSKVAEVQVEIPTFMLNGQQELSLTSSGVSQMSLSGSALTTFDDKEGCDADGYYARVKQIVYNKDEFEDVSAILIADTDVDLAPSEESVLQVLAYYNSVTATRVIENSKLTFTSSDETIATVDNTGKVTAVANGTAVISVIVTSKPSLEAKAVVTVETPQI